MIGSRGALRLDVWGWRLGIGGDWGGKFFGMVAWILRGASERWREGQIKGRASLPFASDNCTPSPPSTQNPRDRRNGGVVRRGEMKEKPYCLAEFTR
jgi:hypothetical protein